MSLGGFVKKKRGGVQAKTKKPLPGRGSPPPSLYLCGYMVHTHISYRGVWVSSDTSLVKILTDRGDKWVVSQKKKPRHGLFCAANMQVC